MKYYRLRQYTKEGKYCSHRLVKTDDDINTIVDAYEKYDEITKEEYEKDKSIWKF